MRLTLLKSIQLVLLLLIIHVCQAQTSSGFKLKRVLSGATGQLVEDANVTVNDSLYFNFAQTPRLDTSYQVRNIITFSINEYSPLYLPASFNATAQIRIYYTLANLSIDSVDQTLTINYDTASSYTARSSFVFNNAHKVKIKVLHISASADVLSALQLENEMEVHPVYKLSRTEDAVQSVFAVSTANTDSTDELQVNWTAITGADVYDLEWAYVDSSAVDSGRYGIPVNPKLIFENNTTRVTVSDNKYFIPLLYDNGGVLYFRVRAVQEKSDYSRFETAWSSDYSAGLGKFGFVGHQRKLNWQSSISFAEEGKRKVVVQYFDGSLRSRQTVTKDNTTNNTIVAETFYDYQGRPAVQVLPAPTLNTVLKYSRNINAAMNGAEYDKDRYDHIDQPSDLLTGSAAPMGSNSGANQYYSPNNPEKNIGMNQYIPDAQGYAFTETEYEPDGTGRIRRQGGVGSTFQLGSNHEAKYFYSGATQNDLDALFGTEAGDASHYFKNMVRDANGQYAVSYLDMHGRTIATALAGSPQNASLADLPSKEVLTVTDSLSGVGSNVVSDLTMSNHHSLVITQDDTVTFHYRLAPPVLTKDGCDTTINYKAIYDLEIKITDDSYNLHVGVNGQPFDTVLRVTDAIDVTFKKYLVKGTYEIHKTLQVNKARMDYYRDSIFLKNAVCSSEEQFISDQTIQQREASCVPDCQSCRASVGTWDEFRVSFVVAAGNSIQDTALYSGDAWSAYNEALSACNDLCGTTTETEDILTKMLLDMSGPSGQYATVSDSIFSKSIFHHDDDNPLAPYQQDDIIYLDESSHPDLVYDENTNTYVKPQLLTSDQFADRFRSSWAPALLPFHPEYCKYIQMQHYAASEAWDIQFSNTDTYAEAKAAGYLNPTGRADVSSIFGSINTDPLASEARDSLDAKLTKYAGTYSMWSFAAISIKCGANDPGCPANYSTEAAAFNPQMCSGDLDMAWRTFRDLYQGVKRDIISAAIIKSCKNNGLTSDQILKAGKQVRFNNSADIISKGGMSDYVGSELDTTAIKNSASAIESDLYETNCRAYVAYWTRQLAPCKYTDTASLNQLMDDLVEICKAGSDLNHTKGSSTVKPGATGTKYKSFDEALAAYNSLHGIDSPLVCNGELIAIPRPYDKQVAFSNIPAYTKPTDCQCDKLHDLVREYEAVKKPADTDLASYLNRTRGTSLSQSDLNILLDACNTPAAVGCSYLPKMVNIPPVMQCDVAPACVSCAEISTLYTKYQAAYPGNLPVVPTADSLQMQKNKLFAAYMNNHLGFSKDAWEYKEFIDSCNAISNPNGTVVCKPLDQTVVSRITNQYNNGGTTNVINDFVRTKTNGYLLAGYTSACSAGGTDGYMIKTDSAGGLIWSKTFGGEQDDQFVRVRATADSGFIAIGNTNSYCYDLGAILIVKVDAAGNVKWNRAIDMGAGFGAEGTDIIELSDGRIAFAGLRTENTIGKQWITGVLSDSGQLSWMKQWYAAGQLGNTVRTEIYLVENNDTLVAAGGASTSSGSLQDILVFKTNKSTGELLNSKAYDAAGETTALLSIVKTTTGYKIATANATNNYTYGGILDISHGGNIIRANKVISPLASGNFSWYTTATSDGGLLMNQYSITTPQDVYWYKLGADNSMQWSKRVRVDGGRRFFNKIIQNADGTIAGAGFSPNAGNILMLGSSSGKGSCRDTVYDNPISGISTFTASIVTNGNISAEVKLGDNNLSSISLIETVCTNTRTIVSCPETDSCYTVGDGPLLCGNAEPVFTAVDVNDISNCSDSTFFAVSAGRAMYRAYLDSVTNNFNEDYIKTTLTAGDLEQFAVTYSSSEYHYTLYYYDQAGNLVKTVPPAGVVKNRSIAWLDQVKAARRDNLRLVPAHKMVTVYKYNTLNQVVAQKTPDAGQSHFWYDRLGRIVASQNAKQVLDNNYSYTLFDDLGRITEVGELTSSNGMTDEISRKASALNSWIAAVSSSKTQITQTVYDQPLTPFGGELWNPVNLRNRVSWSAVYNTYADVLGGDYVTGSFYTYDILGNVKTLLQDYKTIVTSKQADRWKRINYDYDLVSGKVNMVSYQAGNPDAFYHRYSYDAENRITGVATSHDSVYWENDAYYQYYKHGPVARAIIGEQQVQGIDYAYTLQGWLKGVNSTALTPAYDMGGDGSMVAKDAFGFALHYFGNEYSPVNSSKTPFANPAMSKPLFNGNIAAISQHLPTLGAPLLSSYSYDVLNRLVCMQVSNGLNTSTNTWTPVALDDYKEKISYDANGNILTYSRNGNKADPNKAMDRLAYAYKAGKNQLDFITDSVGVAAYDNDIDNQLSANYAYDSIGNLVKDIVGGITEIKWNVYGKIASIKKADNTIISYAYDVAGNRISKKVNNVQTWYVRDATGNVMSIYTKGDTAVNGGALTQTEIDLYGSSRLGINTLSTNVETTALATTNLTGLGNGINISFIRGKKFFELSNHLGNVLATVSDKKLGVSLNGSIIDYYIADIVSAQEYYPFGMQMPGRGISSSKYRYGFNGKENDNDVKGEGNQQDYGLRVYDPRIGKFLSVDPLTRRYPWYTPYQFAGNTPIQAVDLDGGEEKHYKLLENSQGKPYLKLINENTVHEYNLFGFKLTFQIDAERADVNYNGTHYYIGYGGYKGATNQNKIEEFHEWAKNPDPSTLDKNFDSENASTNKSFANSALAIQNNTIMYGSLTSKAWFSQSEENVAAQEGSLNKNCFVAGTTVLTKAGSKDIVDIIVGDSVWSYNEISCKSELSIVVEKFINKAHKLAKLQIDSISIWTTPEHPFFIRNKWIASNQIRAGDSVTLFGNKRQVVSYCLVTDSSALVYNFTVYKLHNYYVSAYGVLVHNDCSFAWQKNKAMNDIVSKSIHGDVFNKKGIKIGEVGFEFENGAITPKALGRNLSNADKRYIENVGYNQLKTAGFKEQLLSKVNEALGSGQLPAGNRVIKLQGIQQLLTPPKK